MAIRSSKARGHAGPTIEAGETEEDEEDEWRG